MEFNGEHDHVHLLINYPPKVAPVNRVASLKGVSSRLLRQQFGDFHPWLKRRGVLWSPSHFASSCGGAPIDILRQYIEGNQTPRLGRLRRPRSQPRLNPGLPAHLVTLLENPAAGDLIPGGRGLRKLRVPPRERKTGGARVIYYHWVSRDQCYLVYAYAKMWP